VPDAVARQIEKIAAALIHENGDLAPAAERRHLAEGRLGGEPDDPVVARMHLEDETGPRPYRPLDIRQTRLVRRPDFPEDRAALAHDVGDAEGAADLDQLSPRHDDLP